MPHYLWGLREDCTILTSSLAGNFQYLAISHTWGRWRKKEAWADLKKVPWPVPENVLFQVRELPYLLKKLPINVEYVWIDLLCIPQDDSKPKFEEIRRQEIARQGSIFSNAACAIAWINDVASWQGLQSAIRWLAFTWLKANRCKMRPKTVIKETGIALDDLIRKAEQTAYMELDQSSCIGPHLQVFPWFNSLWTLQEQCLRPDMLLCNGSFELLTTEPSFFVTGDMCAALVHATLYSFVRPETPPDFRELASENIADKDPLGEVDRKLMSNLWSTGGPYAVQELRHLLRTTGLWPGQAVYHSPTSILKLGMHRQCTGRRAEAIMAVVGATDWYQVPSTPVDRHLVLGLCPLEFSRELRNKVGSNFFIVSFWTQSINLDEPNWSDVKSKNATTDLDNFEAYRREDSIPRGTMLPFSRMLDGFDITNMDWPVYTNHEAISGWSIHGSGSISVPSVAVEMSYPAHGSVRTSRPNNPWRDSFQSMYYQLGALNYVHRCDSSEAQSYFDDTKFGGVKHLVLVGE